MASSPDSQLQYQKEVGLLQLHSVWKLLYFDVIFFRRQYHILWSETNTKTYVSTEKISLPQDILKTGLEVGVAMPENLCFYEDAFFEKLENGEYYCKFLDGTIKRCASELRDGMQTFQ